jgi:hypothetical protein
MNHRTTASWLLTGVLVLSSSLAFAAGPVRKTSQNGSDDAGLSWNLFGPTLHTPTDGGDFSVAMQVICTDRTVGAFVELSKVVDGVIALTDVDSHASGSCVPDPNIDTTSRYLFLFQVQTSKKNFKATISNLVGFVPDPVGPNYGLEICDANNTLQLCANISETDAANLNVTTTVSPNNRKITFVARKLPVILPGVSVSQGQGLTFVVLTEQPINVPVAVPKFKVQ